MLTRIFFIAKLFQMPTKKVVKNEETVLETPQVKNGKKFSITKKQIAIVGLVLFLALTGVFLKKWFIVAMINNRPITRLELDRELEKQGGKQVLDGQITQILIQQQAKDKNIVVSQEEVDKKVKEIEAQLSGQGQKLETILASQGQTKADLEKQIKVQLTVEKLLSGDIKVEDKEISDYFDKNVTYYPKGTTLESKKEEIRSTLLQQKLGEKFQPWLDELKKKSNVQYFISF